MPTAIVPVPISSYDQRIYREGATYNTGTIVRSETTTSVSATKTKAGTSAYYIHNILLLFNTGDYLPDDATVTNASLTVYQNGMVSNESRSLVGDYINYTGTDADYAEAVGGNALSIALNSLGTLDGWKTIPIVNVGNILTGGTTVLRLGLSGGVPSTNNYVSILTFDYSGSTSSSPYLTINYTVPSPPPPPPPPPPGPPTAAFTQTTSLLTANFTSLSSAVSPATISTYGWQFGDGGTSSAANPSYTYATGNTYYVKHFVFDSNGQYSETSHNVTVNRPPVASFTSSGTGFTRSFTDTSTDPDSSGTVTGWRWNFGDGTPESTLKNPVHTFPTSGAKTVTLTVNDQLGATNTTSAVVTIAALPTASFTITGTGLSRTFTDTSTAPGGATITSRSWTFGDTGTSTSTNPSHTYSAPGAYTVSLTVTDSNGNSGTASTTVTLILEGTARAFLSKYVFSVESALSDSMDNTQDSVPVSDLTYWPDSGTVLIDSEMISWTGRTQSVGQGTLTGCTRGMYGTAAVSHSLAAPVGLLGSHQTGLSVKYKVPLMPSDAVLTIQEIRRFTDKDKFVWVTLNNQKERAELQVTSSPTSSGTVTVTTDENGVATTRSASVTATREVTSLTINNQQTSAGNVTVTLNGVAKSVTIRGGWQEQWQVAATSDATKSGPIYIYLDGVLYTVPIERGDRMSDIARKIRHTSYSGWTTSGYGVNVIFVSNDAADHTWSVNPRTSATGVTLSTAQLQEGGPNRLPAWVADTLRGTDFPGWQTGGTWGTATVTFTALEPGDKTGTHSYSPGSTGATSTSGMTVTTNGALDTPTQVASAIRALYSGNAYQAAGGSADTVTWTAVGSGAKIDATWNPGATGVKGTMKTTAQGSSDVVAYVKDSLGAVIQRRIISNLTTSTAFNVESTVAGAGTDKGVVTIWGSLGTAAKVILMRAENLDLTAYPAGQRTYGVSSESSIGLTWDVHADEAIVTDRGETYYREHDFAGRYLNQLYYYGLLEPEEAAQDLLIQDHTQPVLPGQQITLRFYMSYENVPDALPAKPVFVRLRFADGSTEDVGHATNTVGITGDGDWQEYVYQFTIPIVDDEHPVPCYAFEISSRDMSSGTIVIQEMPYAVGTDAERTGHYAFSGTFRAQLDIKTPQETPYLLLERARTALDVQFVGFAGGTVDLQYRSASDPASFDGTWYTGASEVPDLPVIDVDATLNGNGLGSPVVPSGYPRVEYRARPKKRHLFLKPDRTEFAGGVLLNNVQEWYPRPGVASTVLPSGHTARQKLHEPVGYLPSFELWAFRPETVRYLLENLNQAGVEFYAEVFNELLKLRVLTEPEFTRAHLSRYDFEDFGNTAAASRYSFWLSNKLSAEVVSVAEIAE